MNTMRPMIVTAFLVAAAPLAQAGTLAPAPAPAAASPGLFDKMYGTVFSPAAPPKRAALAPRLHDAAHPVLRTARATPHESPSAPVVTAMHKAVTTGRPPLPMLADASFGTSVHYASFTAPGSACDSLLCSNYAILGVGF